VCAKEKIKRKRNIHIALRGGENLFLGDYSLSFSCRAGTKPKRKTNNPGTGSPGTTVTNLSISSDQNER
jgi:hypothetical protein